MPQIGFIGSTILPPGVTSPFGTPGFLPELDTTPFKGLGPGRAILLGPPMDSGITVYRPPTGLTGSSTAGSSSASPSVSSAVSSLQSLSAWWLVLAVVILFLIF